MLRHHSATAHVAYGDLLQSLLDEAVSEIRGTPTKVTRNDRAYWYDSFRVGSEVRKRYIGEDNPELRARMERLREIRATAKERQQSNSRLIRILRAEGFLGVDAATGSLLSAMSQAGVFRLGGTVVGTVALRLYEGELGLRLGGEDAMLTQDIDIASFERLSLALNDTVETPLEKVLGDFEFEPVLGLDPEKVWRWRQTRGQMLVEFLTPSFEADEGVRPLAALGVEAQALHHLNYLIAQPIPAAVTYRSGVLVQVPRPERFAIHKLIVADRRRDRLKARKDRAQAEFLIRALAEDRPDELGEAWQDARAIGPKWRERLDRTLTRMPQSAALLAAL